MSVSSTKLTVPKRINLTLDAIAQVTALALIYVVLIFILPASRETMHAYKFSTIEYRIIDLAVNIPSILVWFAAFMGYATLKHYAKSLEGSEEAASYKKLAIGFGWLAWSLPATALISIIVSSISYKVNGFKPASIIITNYINLLLPLIAFTIISTASRSIASKAKLKISLAAARINILLYLTAAVFKFDKESFLFTCLANDYYDNYSIPICLVYWHIRFLRTDALFKTNRRSFISTRSKAVSYRIVNNCH
jgi:hypothetical protein